jgi:hypothetical protein
VCLVLSIVVFSSSALAAGDNPEEVPIVNAENVSVNSCNTIVIGSVTNLTITGGSIAISGKLDSGMGTLVIGKGGKLVINGDSTLELNPRPDLPPYQIDPDTMYWYKAGHEPANPSIPYRTFVGDLQPVSGSSDKFTDTVFTYTRTDSEHDGNYLYTRDMPCRLFPPGLLNIPAESGNAISNASTGVAYISGDKAIVVSSLGNLKAPAMKFQYHQKTGDYYYLRYAIFAAPLGADNVALTITPLSAMQGSLDCGYFISTADFYSQYNNVNSGGLGQAFYSCYLSSVQGRSGSNAPILDNPNMVGYNPSTWKPCSNEEVAAVLKWTMS